MSCITITVKPTCYIQETLCTTSYTARRKCELSYTAGAHIYVVLVYGNGWCVGMLNGKYGLVQQKYLTKVGGGSGGRYIVAEYLFPYIRLCHNEKLFEVVYAIFQECKINNAVHTCYLLRRQPITSAQEVYQGDICCR